MNEPIFIVGLSRSGTTLLQNILTNHPNISIYYESHFLDSVKRLVNKEFLTTRAEIQKAIKGMQNLQTEGIAVHDIEEGFMATDKRATELWDVLLKLKAKKDGKERFGDKTPSNFIYLDDIFEYYPYAKVIFMYRDPRDRYCSYKYFSTKKVSIIDKTAIGQALYWAFSHDAMWRHNNSLRSGQIMSIKFEDMIIYPEKTVELVCQFLNEEYRKELLSVHNNSSFKVSRGKPGIRKEVLGRARLLNKADTFLIELICGNHMVDKGYKLSVISPSTVRVLKKIKFYFCLKWCYFFWRELKATTERLFLHGAIFYKSKHA